LLELNFAKKCLLSAAAAAGLGGPIAIGLLSVPSAAAFAQQSPAAIDGVPMKHYESAEWQFALDIPKRWNAFPPVSGNSPNEVIRFLSNEDGVHNLIVFRLPYTQQSLASLATAAEKALTRLNFGNFVLGEITIGSRKVVTLDFDRPASNEMATNGRRWSCRSYYITDGTLLYILGFGTTNREAMFPLYDKMARTFVAKDSST
jgi:hypothetical protein